MTVFRQHLAILPALWLPDGFNGVLALSTPLLSEGPEQLTFSKKSLPPGVIGEVEAQQNGCWHFTDDFFKCILLHAFSVIISLGCVLKSLFNNKSSLVQVMACCWTGEKPLSEPMIAHCSMMHICFIQAIYLARNDNSKCANENLGCSKCQFWRKSSWKLKNWCNFMVCN